MNEPASIILGLALVIIMLGMGLGLVPDDFRRILLYPKAIIVGLVNQLLLLPMIALVIAFSFDLSSDIAIGIMILAACPGGATSNLISHLARADVALSVSLTAVSSLITILTIPFIVNFALVQFLEAGQMIRLDVLETIIRIMIIIVIPVVIGMAIRKYREDFAIQMDRPVRIASALILALVIVGIIVKEREHIASYFREAGLAALILNITTMVTGYLSALLFRINKKQALSISIESGIQNGTLAIMIATVLLGNSAYAIAPAVYSLLMFFTGGVLIYWGTMRAGAEGKSMVP